MFKLTAINVADKIDVKSAKAAIVGQAVVQTISEVFIKVDNEHYITVFNNGIVVFANYDEGDAYRILYEISSFMTNPQRDHLKETLLIDTSGNEKVYYEDDVLYVPDDLNRNNLLRLTMYDLAQSVAIDYYSNIADVLQSSVEKFTEELEQKGRISLSPIDMNKFIGKSLNTKNKIVKNLYLFDNPDIVWEEGDLEIVHKVLVRNYDLNARIKEIQSTFAVIDDNLNKFQEMYQHKHAAKLEIIVIILILVEIFNTWFEWAVLMGK